MALELDGEPVFPLLSFHWNKHTGRSTWRFPLLGQMSRHLGTLLGLSCWSSFDNLRWAFKSWQVGRWFSSAALLSCNLGGTNGRVRKLQEAGCKVQQIQGGLLDSCCGVVCLLSAFTLQLSGAIGPHASWHTGQGWMLLSSLSSFVGAE